MSVTHQPLCEKLKATREGRGLSLADVAHVTRIPIPRLCQLEEGNYAAFGNMAYARGFIRIYSQFLGIDAEAFISGLPEPVLGGSADYRHLTESFGPWIDARGPRLPAAVRKKPQPGSPMFTALLLTLVLGTGLAVFADAYIAPAWVRKAPMPFPPAQVSLRTRLLPSIPAKPLYPGLQTGMVSAEMNLAESPTMFVDAAHPRVPYRRATLVEDSAGDRPIAQ